MEAKEFIDKNFSGKADNFQITRYMFEDCLTRFANSNDKIKVADRELLINYSEWLGDQQTLSIGDEINVDEYLSSL